MAQTETSPITAAAAEYVALRDREIHPAGTFDKQGRWYPAEKCECCTTIRRPSGAWPYSLLVHQRSAVHVAAKYGVAPVEVKRAARQMAE